VIKPGESYGLLLDVERADSAIAARLVFDGDTPTNRHTLSVLADGRARLETSSRHGRGYSHEIYPTLDAALLWLHRRIAAEVAAAPAPDPLPPPATTR
jgi:hypothetical protein